MVKQRLSALKLILVAGVVLLGVLVFQWFDSLGNHPIGAQVMIDRTRYQVKVAQTDEQRRKGLSFEPRLTKNAGLLFIFDSKGCYPFWNYGLGFPIDLIYILDDRVIEIAALPAQGKEGPVTYQPQRLSTHVLEVNAGEVEKNHIRVGDRVAIKL